MSNKAILPAGEYYIGDLCYVMHEEWDEFCNDLTPGEHTIAGKQVWWNHTSFGDGTYFDTSCNKYDVDAGLIGLIKLEDIDLTRSDNFTDGGRIVTFNNPVECDYKNGVFCFQDGTTSVVINTEYDEEDEDEDWDDSGWYQDEHEEEDE